MKSMEFYKGRFADTIEEGFSEPKGVKNLSELFNELGQKGKCQKIKTLVQIINELAPQMVTDKILEMFPKEDPSKLPFNPEKLEFKDRVGKGGEHDVYLLESTKLNLPSYVLKMNHLIFGKVDEIQKQAVAFKKEYEEIKARYSAIPEMVPDELTLVTQRLKGDKPAIATIQKFYGTDIKDPVRDFKNDELIELLNNEPELFDDFKQFLEITEKDYEEKGVALDLLGNKNLSVVQTENGPKLMILDPHATITKSDDLRTKEHEMYMEKLKDIYNKALLEQKQNAA
jgi:hypothetical protein